MKKEYLIIGGLAVIVAGYLLYKSKAKVNLATKDGDAV